MVIANLPPLKHGGPRTPVTAGSWVHDEVSLEKLSDYMDISAEGTNAHQLKSIPDAWARVQISRKALKTSFDLVEGRQRPRHPVYPEVRRHWRALLALFGLAQEYAVRYRLIVKTLTLPAAPSDGDVIDSAEMFAKVLALLPPTAVLHDEQANWSTLGIIQVQDARGGAPVTVGLLTPDTLVTSGKSIADLTLESVPWFQNGPRDPVEMAELKSLDFKIMASFLTDVIKTLEGFRTPKAEELLRDRVMEELTQYLSDCNARVGQSQHHVKQAPATPVDIPTKLHAPFGKTYVINEDQYPVGQSDCLLRLRADIATGLQGVVLIDPSIATDGLKRPLNDVCAWRHRMLSDAADPSILNWIREDAAKAGYLVVTRADFFTSDLVIFEPETDIPGHLADSFNNALLPLTPLALLVMTPGELVHNVRQDPGPGDERRVTLTVQMKDGSRLPLPAKTYDKNLEGGWLRQDVTRPINLAVWPDFQSSRWPWNYLRYNHDPNSTDVQTRFGISGQQIANDMGRAGGSEALVARAREWFNSAEDLVGQRLADGFLTSREDSGNVLQRLRFQSTPNAIGEIQISRTPFEALCFARRRDRNSAPRPIGIALLQRNPKEPANRGKAIIAVDFGTTNTVVATSPDVSSGLKNGRALTLRKRTTFPITAKSPQQQGRDVDELAWQFRDFMPLMSQPTPIPTVSQDRDIIGGHLSPDQLAHDPRPLFSDSIFFFPAVFENEALKRQVTPSFLDYRHAMIFGLKWDPQMEPYAKNFLRQLLLMSAAEMAADGYAPDALNWRFSYPEAMRGARADRLADNYTTIVRGLFEDDAVASQATPRACTESEAAAAYFLNKDVVRSLTVVLDIGGGTTDVAIWLKEGRQHRMLWHGSVKIAGGDFMTHYLVNNPKLLDELGIPQIKAVSATYQGETSRLLRDEAVTRGQPRLKDLAELFFSDERFSDGFRNAYNRLAEQPLGTGLRHSAMVASGGMLFYVGNVIRHLIDTGAISEGQYDNPTIAFGGRGALFLKLLGGTHPEESRRLKALGGMMSRGAGFDPKTHEAQIYFSPEPKLEAVLGMLDPGGEEAVTNKASTFMPVGETLDMSGETPPGPWSDIAALGQRQLKSKPTLACFDDFLNVLFEETGISVELDGPASLNARGVVSDYVDNQLKAELNRLARETSGTRQVNVNPIEPAFIMALRATLDRLGQSEDVRQKFLRVGENNK